MQKRYITLFPEYRGAIVRLAPVHSPNDEFPYVLMAGTWCSQHQAKIEGFTGQLGRTMVSNETFRGRRNDPVTYVHFGVGDRKGFRLEDWRTALTPAFELVRNYNVDHISLELSFVFENCDPFEFGKLTGQLARTVLYREPTTIFNVMIDTGLHSYSERTAEMNIRFDQGLRAGFNGTNHEGS